MEVGALARESIVVRGFQIRMGVRGEIAPAPAVGEDEDDVGAMLGSGTAAWAVEPVLASPPLINLGSSAGVLGLPATSPH